MNNVIPGYEHIRNGGPAFHTQPRGLIEVWGGEAVPFLNGLITNDVAALADGEMMLAAFPNVKGRLLAVVRVKRRGDTFIFETEDATHETVFQTLFKFSFAGDFHVKDVTEKYVFVSLWNSKIPEFAGSIVFGRDLFVAKSEFDSFKMLLSDAVEVSRELYEIIRIEEGIPLYGKDMDDTTVVPETGIEGLISYHKGCYIGQEVIARIHFLGKPAKLLKGLVFEAEFEASETTELTDIDGKSAGRITSTAFSPNYGKTIGLGYVRNAYTGEGTELLTDGISCTVKELPFTS